MVATVGEALDRLGGQDVDTAVDPIRNSAAFAETRDDIPVAELDDAERRGGPSNGDGRRGRRLTVQGEKRREVDVDELVAVQRVDVPVLGALPRRELDPASTAEAFRLLGADDLRTEAGQLPDEQLALPCGTRDDHPGDARAGQATDLVRGQRLVRDLDQRLRAAARGVTEALGLAAGQDDRLHYALGSFSSGSGVSAGAAEGEVARPIAS